MMRVLSTLVALGLTSTASASEESRELQDMTLAETLTGLDEYSTLLSLVSMSPDLLAAVSDPTSTLTILGPDNEAFAALDTALVTKLTTAPYIKHLESVLFYHGAGSELMSTDLSVGDMLTMLNGEMLEVVAADDTLGFTNMYTDATMATVAVPDVEASNGVFHGITGVLLPSFLFNDIVDRAIGADMLSTLTSLLVTAGLEDAVRDGEFTVLAPTNEAFAAVPQETLDALTDPANVELLQGVLLYHALTDILPSTMIMDGMNYATAQGSTVMASVSTMGVAPQGVTVMAVSDMVIMFGDATVVASDILASNGIVHVIDTVLIPSVETGAPMTPPAGAPTMAPADTSDGKVVTGSFVLGIASALAVAMA